MGDTSSCGVTPFTALEPERQAEFLAMLAQQARLLRFSLEGGDSDARRIGDRLQRALEQAMDAESAGEIHGAREELQSALAGARDAGLRLSAQVGEMDVDGIVGSMKMRVLSTVLTARDSRHAA